ncbi:hypothetical protein MTO96_000548 [Rhipicephalus appendiculatus]
MMFNAVALVDSVPLVWEKYFGRRVVCHACSRVATHQLMYKRLFLRVADSAVEAIQVVGSGQYAVPSATHPSFSYEVFEDTGLCASSFESKLPFASTML